MSRPPASSLLLDLAREGVQVSAKEGRLRIAAPPGVITPERREALERERSALLGLMTEAEVILEAPLGVFEQAATMIEVAVPRLKETLWFVSGPEQPEILEREGVRRGRIWTAVELRDLLAAPGMTHDDALSVARAKLAFNATVADVRPADASTPVAPPAATPPELAQSSLDFQAQLGQEHDL